MSSADERAIRRTLGAGIAGQAETAAQRFATRAAERGLVDVAYATYDSPIGTGVVAATERGVVRIGLPNQEVDAVLADLSAAVSPKILELPDRLDPVRRELDQYFDGRRHEFEVELDWRLVRSGFGRRVLAAASRELPFGVTATYGEVAGWAGSPRAYRAAGSALARNPIPIVVPCHRVLRSGGAIGEYGGGPAMKEWLLRLEGVLDAG